MSGSAAFNFIRHISKMGAATGGKRIFYAFLNIFLIALCVLSAIGIKVLFAKIFTEIFLVALIGFLVCIVSTLWFFLMGFVGQCALVIIAGMGIADPEERGSNIFAFVVALLTVIAAVVALIVLLNIV